MSAAEKPQISAASPDEIIGAQRNRQIVILTAAIIVLAGLVGLSRLTRGADTKSEPVALVPESAFKREDVGQIEMKRGSDAPLILRRDGDSGWRVPSKFNAPADTHDIDMLLNKVFDSKRLGKPSTEDTTKYALYALGDDEAVQLRLCDAQGRELLKLLVGKGEDGSRDFIRLAAEGAPAGIFELANPTGSWDSLFSRMNLDTESRPDAKRWLDLSGFKAIPPGARVTAMTVTDAGTTMEFHQDPADDKKWNITRPGRFTGENAAIQGIVTALEGLSAADIAGQDKDAPALGVADGKRTISVEYTHENKPEKSVLAFGTVKDSQVAVHLKAATQGSNIYWTGDHVLARIFRKLTEFAAPADVSLVPLTRRVEKIRMADGEKQLEVEDRGLSPGNPEWVMLKPREGKAEKLGITTLTQRLNTLRGAISLDKPDIAALGVDPATATRWLELTWTEPGEKKEGEEKPADVKKTAALYFATTDQDPVAVLKRIGGQEDQVFWLSADTVKDIFAEPESYQEVKVRQILISWKGKNANVTPKLADRTEEQARTLVAELIKRATDGEDFQKLQAQYDEDSVPGNVYPVTVNSNFVEPFKKLALRLPLGGVDSCDSDFGIHILKRIE